ncbi:MAG: hypothetical protein OHK0013_31890 [Sandaracinaceae bacterium]
MQVELELGPPPPPPVVATPEAPAAVVVVDAPRPPRASYQLDFAVPFRALVEAQLGWSAMEPAVDGHTAALGLSLELDALPWLAFGLHGHASWRSALSPDANRDGVADRPAIPVSAYTLTGGPRFRIFTADESRDHLGLELGGGILWLPDHVRLVGAVLEVALHGGLDLRGVGPASNGGFVLAPVVRFQQGLADAGSYRALLVGLSGGFEMFTSPQRGAGPRSGPRFTLGGDVGLGGGFLRQGTVHEGFVASVGLGVGLVLGEVFEPRLRVDFTHRVAGRDRDGLDVYGVAGGFRVLFDPWAPVYLEAMAGWASRHGTPAREVEGGIFLDAGGGLRWLDCGGGEIAWLVGVRTRVGLLQADALSSIVGVLGVELDGGPRPDRPRCRVEVPSVAFEAPPPPTVYVPQAPRETPPPPPPAPPAVAPEAPSVERVAVASPRAAAEEERTPSGPTRIPLSVELNGLVGAADADRRIDGLVSGLGVALGVAPIDELVLQLRFAGLGGSDEARDLLPPFAVDDEETAPFAAWLLGGALRVRLFTDAAERSGWTFDLGGGYLTLDGAPEPGRRAGWQHGGYLEAAIGHQRGVRFADGFAMQMGVSLRFQQGLGDDVIDYRALLLTGSVSLEADTPAASPGGHAGFQYTLGATARGGLSFYRFSETGLQGFGGVGVHFGLPIGRWIEPRVRADLHFIPNAVERSTSPLLAFLGALRLRLDEVVPMYVEAAGGYALHYDVAGQRSPGTSVVELGVGARLTDCSGGSDGAIEVGAHLRLGVEGPRTDDALFLTIGYEYAGGPPMFGQGERAHCRMSASSPDVDERVTPRGPSVPPPAAPPSGPVPPVVVPVPDGPPPGPPPVVVPVPGGPPPVVVPGPPPVVVPVPGVSIGVEAEVGAPVPARPRQPAVGPSRPAEIVQPETGVEGRVVVQPR